MSPEPSRLDVHPLRCDCARCRVEAALLLLRTDRAAMALHLLELVPDAITEALGWAFAAGHDGVPLGRRSGPPTRLPLDGRVGVADIATLKVRAA